MMQDLDSSREPVMAFPTRRDGTSIELFARTLDSMGIAAYLLDFEERTILWNETFLTFFPEHAGHITAGEHYRDNLRRFYQHRLTDDELEHIDRYIERGIARHRAQTRPFSFEHRGRWVRAAVQTIPGIGRIRTWTQINAPQAPDMLSDPTSAGGAFSPSIHQASVQELPDAILVLAPSGRILSHNEPFRQLYGLSVQEQIVGSTYEDLLRRIWRKASPDGSDSRFEREILSSLRDEQRFAGTAFEVSLPGDRWVRIVEQRNPDGLRSCVHFEISQFKREHRNLQRAEADARAREARFRTVIERLPVGMSIAKPDGAFVEVNESYGRIFGYKPEDLAGRSLWDIIDPGSIEQTRSAFEALALGRISSMEHESKFRHRNNTERWVIHSAVLLTGENGQQSLIISQIQDITGRKQIEQELDEVLRKLSHSATHDSLTELPNRTRFEQRLQLALTESRRSGFPSAVCFIDLDRFKIINDTAGHLAGDALLKQIGATLQAHVPPESLISRFGGDEFGLLLPNCDVDAAEAVCQRLIDAVKSLSLSWNGQHFTVGMSVGVAQIDEKCASVDQVVQQADEACYAAKRAGRECVRIHAAAL
jgi:diguanylate cyclase (GGDEF)-like protein/PAS domain S-box-containing protein